MARSCHVAVIGAGLAGLVTARELSREGHRVVVFEKGERVGGTWVYDPRVESELLGLDSDRKIVHSSLYRSLRTNFPRWGMCFLDFDFTTRQYGDPRNFPWHEEVLAFLDDFTSEFDLTRLIRFGSEVVQVRGGERRDEWVVEWRSQRSESETTNSEVFEAVVVCNGHHTEPQIADDVAGLDKWPGKQMHSHNYRIPELFQDQIVVLIGNGPSSSDISREISKFAKEVHRASRTKDIDVGKLNGHDSIWQHPMIESAHEDGRVVFRDGTSILPDVIIHCTGYKYRFPFLEKSGVVGVDDNRVEHLYKHVFPPHFAPCLSFVGIPDKGNIFLVSELQSKWIAQVLSGKVLLPTEEEMMESVKELYHNMEESGTPKRFTHALFPHEFEYINWVAAQVGLPPMEEWREQILYEVFKVIRANRDSYRDDCYWSRYPHSSIRSSEQHPPREQLLLEIIKRG